MNDSTRAASEATGAHNAGVADSTSSPATIVQRFAAMAERAKADEQALARRPGESEQSFLDRRCAVELASLSRDEPPPRALDLLDVPASKLVTADARGRAIAYVSKLIVSYIELRRSPWGYKVNVTAKIEHLRSELGLMQSTDPEGVTLARRWDFLCGDLV